MLTPDEAVNEISKIGIKAGGNIDAERGISSFVIPSVLWSLYSFLKSPEDYWETICTSIMVGGDVDITAAMAGAISGAYNGFDAIPICFSKYVTDKNDWKITELVELAHRCYVIKMSE